MECGFSCEKNRLVEFLFFFALGGGWDCTTLCTKRDWHSPLWDFTLYSQRNTPGYPAPNPVSKVKVEINEANEFPTWLHDLELISKRRTFQIILQTGGFPNLQKLNFWIPKIAIGPYFKPGAYIFQGPFLLVSYFSGVYLRGPRL